MSKKRKTRKLDDYRPDPDDVFDFGPWLNAFAWYEQGQREPLIDMLMSDSDLTPTVRYFLADLLDRQPKLRRGKSKWTPVHTVSKRIDELLAAVRGVKALVEQGEAVRLAVEKVAADTGIGESALAEAYRGGHGGLRRALALHPYLRPQK